MKSRAAVLFEAPGEWEIIKVEVDDPKELDVLVRFEHTSLCHPDDHYTKGLSEEGNLLLDELVTRRCALEDINQGYADMHAGINLCGIIDFQPTGAEA